jgi:hypothetical protein
MGMDELVAEFANCVENQKVLMDQGDPDEGNKYAKRYVSAFEKLREFGDDGRNALMRLFTDPRTEVRVMAASYLLRHCEADAKDVLEREAKGAGLVAFGASQALMRWEDGTWALDLED